MRHIDSRNLPFIHLQRFSVLMHRRLTRGRERVAAQDSWFEGRTSLALRHKLRQHQVRTAATTTTARLSSAEQKRAKATHLTATGTRGIRKRKRRLVNFFMICFWESTRRKLMKLTEMIMILVAHSGGANFHSPSVHLIAIPSGNGHKRP